MIKNIIYKIKKIFLYFFIKFNFNTKYKLNLKNINFIQIDFTNYIQIKYYIFKDNFFKIKYFS